MARGEAPAAGYVDPHFPDPNGVHDATVIIYGYSCIV